MEPSSERNKLCWVVVVVVVVVTFSFSFCSLLMADLPEGASRFVV